MEMKNKTSISSLLHNLAIVLPSCVILLISCIYSSIFTLGHLLGSLDLSKLRFGLSVPNYTYALHSGLWTFAITSSIYLLIFFNSNTRKTLTASFWALIVFALLHTYKLTNWAFNIW
jgi:hypothetical protein